MRSKHGFADGENPDIKSVSVGIKSQRKTMHRSLLYVINDFCFFNTCRLLYFKVQYIYINNVHKPTK